MLDKNEYYWYEMRLLMGYLHDKFLAMQMELIEDFSEMVDDYLNYDQSYHNQTISENIYDFDEIGLLGLLETRLVGFEEGLKFGQINFFDTYKDVDLKPLIEKIITARKKLENLGTEYN